MKNLPQKNHPKTTKIALPLQSDAVLLDPHVGKTNPLAELADGKALAALDLAKDRELGVVVVLGVQPCLHSEELKFQPRIDREATLDLKIFTSPNGTRTRAPALRGPCPNQLDDRAVESEIIPPLDSRGNPQGAGAYSTVTDLAKLRGLSTSLPKATAVWYEKSWRGITFKMG